MMAKAFLFKKAVKILNTIGL